jgi:hypothetical protein
VTIFAVSCSSVRISRYGWDTASIFLSITRFYSSVLFINVTKFAASKSHIC